MCMYGVVLFSSVFVCLVIVRDRKKRVNGRKQLSGAELYRNRRCVRPEKTSGTNEGKYSTWILSQTKDSDYSERK